MDTPTPSTHSTTLDKLVARLSMLVAALMWSTSGLFAKAPIFDGWSESVQGPLFAFWRAAFAALVLIPTVRRPRWKGYLVPLVLCFAAMNITYLTAMTRTTAANAIWLQSTSPWWVFLLTVLVLRHPVARRDLIPLCFGVLGVGTIVFFEIRGQATLGLACGVAAGVAYACVVIFMRQLRRENPAWLVAACHTVSAIIVLPWIIHLGVWPSLGQLAVLAAFGAFQMAFPYLLLVRSLRSISPQEVVAIGLLEPVLMPLWVFLVGWETPDWWTLVGASLILIGLVARYIVFDLMIGKPGNNGAR